MSTFKLVAAVVFFILLARSVLLPKRRRDRSDGGNSSNSEEAEIEGRTWVPISIFEHIERELKHSPDKPAVICTFQAADALDSLVVQRSGAAARQPETRNGSYECEQQCNGLWQKQESIGSFYSNMKRGSHHPKINGFNAKGNGMSKLIQDRATGSISPSTSVNDGTSAPKCLTLTYMQLHLTALKIATALWENDIQSNSTLVMLIPNCAEYAILLWTCIILRITYVSLDPASLEISGFTLLKQTLRMLKPQVVVAPDAMSGRGVDVAIDELGLPQPIRLCLSSQPRTTEDTASRDGTTWKPLASFNAPEELDSNRFPTDSVALLAAARADSPTRINSIMFTSGTSGLPKGCPQAVQAMSHVLYSQSWLIDSAAAHFALMQPHNSRGIAPAQVLQTWRAGGAVVLTGQAFNAREAAWAIANHGITFLVLTPPMVHEMAEELAARPIDVSSVIRIQVGGDTVTKTVLRKCVRLFPEARVCVNHGMTEGGGSFVWPFDEVCLEKMPFWGEICPIGTVAPGSIVRIWDAETKCVSGRGKLGDLHVLAGSLIKHYSGGRSGDSFYEDSKGRWFITGDVAMVDENGVVFILGRKKKIIRRGGVAVMPAAIESSIEAFSGSQAIVVPTPHHVLGREPFAVIRSFNGKTEAQVKNNVRKVFGNDYALGGIASLEMIGLDDFPLNKTRKIVKSEVERAVKIYVNKATKL